MQEQVKVIGAGLARTGTLSLKLALEHLGYDKTYHMEELINSATDLEFWKLALEKEQVDWSRLFAGYQATVDYPGCYFYKELLEFYPHAKVILTVRECSDWYDSVASTIYRLRPNDLLSLLKLATRAIVSSRYRSILPVFWYANKLIWHGHFKDRFADRDFAIEIYNRHIAAVQEHVPSEQLLVFDVCEGWEPLCQFLDRPIPSEAFPHANSRNDFQAKQASSWNQ